MEFLRTRRDLPIYPWCEGLIRIGADDTEVWEIPDPEGHWQHLLGLCDGTRADSAIIAAMAAMGVTTEEAQGALTQLREAGIVVALNAPYTESADDERVRGNLAYFWADHLDALAIQRHLETMTITVIGGGGSHFLMHLAALGVRQVRIVDYDRVDASNLNRQWMYDVQHIGRAKAEMASEYVARRVAGAAVQAFNQKLERVADVQAIIRGSDWVFCAADEPPYRMQRLVNRASIAENIPCIYAFSQRQSGRMMEVIPGVTGCVDCLLVTNDGRSPSFRQLVASLVGSHFQPDTPLISPTLGLMTSWIMKRWVDLVTQPNLSRGNAVLRLDFPTLAVAPVSTWARRLDCVTCGDQSNADHALWQLLPIA
ncbi:MAG: ThiF family adenylyltransferase [Thermaerobacter sp.]|nr:ThiF family adenylyltransferase [Thermaerobacter sp.]